MEWGAKADGGGLARRLGWAEEFVMDRGQKENAPSSIVPGKSPSDSPQNVPIALRNQPDAPQKRTLEFSRSR